MSAGLVVLVGVFAVVCGALLALFGVLVYVMRKGSGSS